MTTILAWKATGIGTKSVGSGDPKALQAPRLSLMRRETDDAIVTQPGVRPTLCGLKAASGGVRSSSAQFTR